MTLYKTAQFFESRLDTFLFYQLFTLSFITMNPPFMTMDSKTTAFLAGLFEGDGYFGPVQFKLELRDQDIVEYVAELLNTTVCVFTPPNESYQVLYKTSLGRKNERDDLYIDLYDWLGARRRMQVREALWQYPESFFVFNEPVKFELSQLPQIGEMPSEYAPSPEEWAYFSGYFVAEGSISFDSRSQQQYDRPSLNISSTDQDVIAFCAKLLSTLYTERNRRTKKGKKVFNISLTNFDKLQSTLKNILPFVSLSSRHREKVEKALEEMEKRIDARSHSSIQKSIRLNLQKELDTFEPKGAPNVDWEELASIFQEHSFVYFVETPGPYGVAKSVRLRLTSADLQIVEKVAKVFGNKVPVVKDKKKTKNLIYETQIEKKKYVFWILKNVVPFLTGQAQIKVEEALHFFQSPDLLKSREYEKRENPDVK
jgi:hypothetical protein